MARSAAAKRRGNDSNGSKEKHSLKTNLVDEVIRGVPGNTFPLLKLSLDARNSLFQAFGTRTTSTTGRPSACALQGHRVPVGRG